MLKIAAFADEISPDIDEQIIHCKLNNVSHIEMRGVANKNVLDFDRPLEAEIKRKLADNGMGVAAIGSPIGKVKIDEAWSAHFDRFKIAVDRAEYLGAPLIRVFSYYPAKKGDAPSIYREEVLRRFFAKIEYLAGHPGITLVHENERDIYGEKGVECLDLMKSIDSPKLRSAFDFANFVQAHEKPLNNWPMLKPYTIHIHIKDAVMATGKVVPAGKGDGQLLPILKDAYGSGYRGFLSLEPHLKVAGHSHGETGPELFKIAADALKTLCAEAKIPLAGVRSPPA